MRVENWDRALWEYTLANRSQYLRCRLDEVQVPTLVITGDDDRLVPADLSVRLASEIPDAALQVIPECGHAPQEERPDRFVEAVTTFVRQLPPGPRS